MIDPPPSFSPQAPSPAPNFLGGFPPPVGSGFRRFIAAVQAAQRRQLWIEGICLGAAIALVLAIGGGFAARLSPGFGRTMLLASPAAFLASVAFYVFWKVPSLVGDEVRTARWIGVRVPHVSLDLLSAVQLASELQRSPDSAPFSLDLARAFLRETDERTRTLAAATVIDPERSRRALRVLLGTALLGSLVLAASFHPWWQGIAAAMKRADHEGAGSALEPITGDIEITYRYPSYTGLAPKTVTGTSGELNGPSGTEVVLKTRADRDVVRADLWVNAKRIPLEVAPNHRDLLGTLVLSQSGSYAIAFINGDKQVARGPDTAIKVEADLPPQVVIETPGEEIEIDPGQKLIVKFSASDDFGISDLSLIYKLPSKAQEERIPLPHDEGRRTRGQYSWDLNGTRLAPAQRITYRIEAKDNDAVSGPKIGASRTHVLKVYSAAEHQREALAKAEEIWKKLVNQLGDRMEGPDRATDKDPDAIAAHEHVDRAGLALIGEMRLVSQNIAKQRDAPAEIWGALLNIAESLQPKTQHTSDARRQYLRFHRLSAVDASPGRRLSAAATTEIGELERSVLYLESLIDRQKIQALKDMSKDLNRERRDVASLIEQYKQTHDSKTQEDILQQIEQLKQHMSELMQRMSELAKGIRDEHFNAEALQEMAKERDLGSQLDELEKLVKAGKADEALKALQQMSMDMDKMLGDLESADDALGEEFPELAKKFGEFSKDLEKTAEDQKRVAEQTKELRDRYRAQMKDRLLQKAQALKEQLLKQVEQVSNDYKATEPDDLNPGADKSLEEVQAELGSVKNGLKVEDYDLAAEAAMRAARAAAEVSSYAQQQRELDELWGRTDPIKAHSRRQSEKLRQDANAVADINKKLQQLFPPPGSMMGEPDRNKLQKLGQEQRQLEQRAQGLQREMEEMQQMAPLFNPEAMDQMNQVGEQMNGAAQQLEGRDPGHGYTKQKAAMDELSEMQKQMQQSQSKGKSRGLPFPMSSANGSGNGGNGGNETNRDKIEIPDADQFQAPKEFRKDLLDAMKQGSPDKYKDQVKHYYEELVK